MGGEPLCQENLFLTSLLVKTVREHYPDIKIYVWTGYEYEELIKRSANEIRLKEIFDNINYIIDGPFILEQRDITLPMRGSKNQRILEIPHDIC